jgi:glycosyltransferase involved in cell wall biosynthesis
MIYQNTEVSLKQEIPIARRGEKLTLITPCVPHPSNGASVVLFYWYTHALKQAGFNILNILILSDSAELVKVEEYKKQIGEDENFRIECVLCNKPIIYNKWLGPRAVNPELSANVARRTNKFNPSKLMCFDLTSAWAAAECDAFVKIVWLGDLNFQSFFYHGVYAFRRGDYRLAITNFLYCYPWRRHYYNALKEFSKIIVSSGSSVKSLAKLGLSSRYLPYPWPIGEITKRATSKIPTFVFFGNLGALGSLSSLGCLVNDIHPRLVELLGKASFKIDILGFGEIPEFAKRAIDAAEEIDIVGFVPNLSSALSACHAMIAPLEAPVGNRSRIVTALAHRLPVVAHVNVSAGNPDLIDGLNCCLGSDAEAMVRDLIKIVSDTDFAERIAEGGRQLYLDKFSPANACAMLLNEIIDIDERRRVNNE